MSAIERVLGALDTNQHEAVITPPGPVCVIAGAGTGKTTALVGRIAYQVCTGAWEPAQVLAVTHSTKAAGNMRDRLRRLGDSRLDNVTAKTFHAAALAVCREYWAESGRKGGVSLVDNAYATVREVLKREGNKTPSTSDVLDLTAEIGWAKASLITPDRYPEEAAARGRGIEGRSLTQVGKSYALYEKVLKDAGQMDFSDLLLIATRIISESPAVAINVRQRWKHILVDEYQDTDPAQEAFLNAILGGRSDVTVVGDARQAIYAFKGSTVTLLDSFPRRYPDATVVRLVRDYRSTPQITALANILMRTPEKEALIGCLPTGPPPELMVSFDEAGEADMVARRVKAMLGEGTPAGQVAILYRYNAQSAAFEQALTSSGVPYTVLDNERFFDRPEIVQVLRTAWGRMRQMEEKEENPDFQDDRSYTYTPGVDVLRDVLSQQGFDRDNPPAVAGGARERWEALNALLELVESMRDAELISARELLDELVLRRTESHHVSTQTVTLSTLHKAKGLEWDTVFIPRMVEGSLPSAYAKTETDLAEEKRLVYVGITRAARTLILSYSRTRGNAKRQWPSEPSRYLPMMNLAEVKAVSKPVKSAPAPASLSPEDIELFKALQKWRKVKADEARMPDFTLMSDTILTAIATRKPTDRLGLLRIPGLGMKKADKYGPELFALLEKYADPFS